jgi:DNA polymerase III subunit alpha
MPPVKVPRRRDMYLIFDTETTGVIPYPPRNSSEPLCLEKCPYILQLSAVLYSMKEQKIVDIMDCYIRVPDAVEIGHDATEVHGITKDLCQSKGISIVDALRRFYDFYKRCECYVGHNIKFDMTMINIELERNRQLFLKEAPECLCFFQEIHEKVQNIESYCTMERGKKLCNLQVFSERTGKHFVKSPKLIELYQHLFPNETPEHLHNSMFDVYATMRCYLKMRHNLDIRRLEQHA